MVSRRTFLKGIAASGLISSSSAVPVAALAKGTAMKVGYVSPRTGPLAALVNRSRAHPNAGRVRWEPYLAIKNAKPEVEIGAEL